MFRRMSAAASTVGLLGFELSAIVVLHRLGSSRIATIDWADLGTWLAEAPPEDAVVAVVRVIALAIAYWLAATTVLYLLAGLAGVPSLVGALRWTTLPPVRRLVDGLVAGSIVAGSTLGGAAFAAADPAPPEQVDRPAYVPTPAGDRIDPVYVPSPAGGGPLKPRPSTGASGPARAEDGSYVVRPGDNLWNVAKAHLAQHTGQNADPLVARDIHAYWVRLIAANRHRLASGNPDLIYPGEHLTLPPLDE